MIDTGDCRVRETEVKLIICAEQPAAVIDQLATLDSIAGYQLGPVCSQTIHDWYLDTLAGALAAKRLALRIRDRSGRQQLTLKAGGGVTSTGAIERLEIERPASIAALREIVAAIASSGVKLRQLPTEQASIHDLARGIGLASIHEHTIDRCIRQIVSARQPVAQVLAELALDAVRCRFNNATYRLYEVEVEAKNESGEGLLVEIKTALMAHYGHTLRSWYHDKLMTALALRVLSHSGTPGSVYSTSEDLPPSVYDRIDAYLRSTTNLEVATLAAKP
ncbi:MAG: CYTH domain-containing protein [Acidiferrobacterales bacterium]